MEVWRLIDSGYLDGAMNMAIDEAILISYMAGKAPPTLRFYGWHPPCLSVGVFQSVSRDVDILECRRKGIAVIRRPTGGRAVLHVEELAYSIVTGQEHPLVSGRISESYGKISSALAAGIRMLGGDVQMAPGDRKGRVETADGKKPRTPACFDAPSDFELVVDGRKLVGSAQMRRGDALLQHGSILLDVRAADLVTLLRTDAQVRRDLLVEMLRSRTVGLNTAIGRKVTYRELTSALARGFEQAASIKLVSSELTEQEHALAVRLRAEKYSNDSWNLRR